MTTDVKIRVLTQRDREAYWNLRLEALEREPQSFIESPEEHRAMAREQGAERLRLTNNSSLVMGAFFKGELVGMAGFFRERHMKTKHKGRIWGVYVRASCRGKGLGRRLLLVLLKRIKKMPGLEQVNLSVSTSLAAARKLYRSLGFKTFGVEDKALKIGDTYLSEEYMVLRLKAPSKKA